MKKLLTGLLILTLCTSAFAEDKAAKFTDPIHGFTINAPDLGPSKQVLTPVIFSGPVDSGFSANVSVRIQPGADKIKSYIAANLAQLADMKATVVSQKQLTVSGCDAVLIEFQATINGTAMHFLSLSVLQPDKIYIVTGTALDSNYAKYEEAFKKCIDSFALPK